MYSDSSQNLAVMSIGFLLQNKDDAVVWRGPKKNGIVICVPHVLPVDPTKVHSADQAV